MKRSSSRPQRSPCPVACALDIIGDRWTLVVVRDLLLGRSFFKDFEASPEGIATNILSDRLARLTASGVVEKRPSRDKAGRPSYHLTVKGRRLKPVVAAIAKWGLENIDGTAARLGPAS